MYESPGSLQDACLDFICDNLSSLCLPSPAVVPVVLPSGDPAAPAPDADAPLQLPPSAIFHVELSERLLETMCRRRHLTDRSLAVFTRGATTLRRVRLRAGCGALTTRGLRTLRQHRVLELDAGGLRRLTVNDVVGCLGDWTLVNLRALSVSGATFTVASGSAGQFSVVVSLSKLRGLHSLDVSHTDFNELGLRQVVEDLPLLERLDISATSVRCLAPLSRCRDRLRSLAVHRLRAANGAAVAALLCQLTALRHLDVSDDISFQQLLPLQSVRFHVDDLLRQTRQLPHLTSLDISGKDSIDEHILRGFIQTHPGMKFVGLTMTSVCSAPMFTDVTHEEYLPHLTVSGEGSEGQIVEALQRYSLKERPVYVQKSLYNLFSLTQQYHQPRTDIVKLIIPGMKRHPKELGVQIAATACLYNLSRGEMGQKLHPYWLAKIVHYTMDAMQNFPNHKQLQKNALLTLCSDRILQDVTFDRFRCARLVMECLCSFDDPYMNRMSVAICGILAAKIPTDQTSRLGAKPCYMNKLLNIVREKAESKSIDITMKFTLSALWNLTDESPKTCEMFLNENGLELFLKVLKLYEDVENEDKVQVETKVLGLINNLAEVKNLRPKLMRADIVAAVKERLQSTHIDVSYFAAGIVSHLVSGGESTWNVSEISQRELLNDLGEAVLRWDQPQGEMVAYRSFSPFFPLLLQFDMPEVQLWAAWAMQHVCMKNGARYCPMLVAEGGTDVLKLLVSSPRTSERVALLIADVLALMEQHAQL